MNLLPGYRIIQKSHEGPNTVIYRAQQEQDGHSVILKAFQPDAHPAKAFSQAQHEYHITRSLNADNAESAILSYRLDQYQNTPWIVFEDFGGESLDRAMQSRAFGLIERLQIAIKITQALGQIHALNIIHNTINPSHIVLNTETGQLKLIGFGLATVFKQEQPTLESSNSLEGSLAYLSPEQTGRVGRLLDQRSDLYSLGVTLYELFGQRLPFVSTDPMELVHCHIARAPMPLRVLNADIPKPLSDIVLKLLAKAPEQRYQSAWGLQCDLEQCLSLAEFYSAQARPFSAMETFPLARRDIPNGFQIPKKLYG